MTDWFEWFDNLPLVDKANINWPVTLDFKLQGKFIVGDIKTTLEKMEEAGDDELLFISQHFFNLISWIDQMQIMGFHSLPKAVDRLLEDEFGNKNVLKEIQKESFDKWIVNKRGQYQIGVNHYHIIEGMIYHRNFLGEWFTVDPSSVYTIMPALKTEAAPAIAAKLESDYSPTKYYKVNLEWKKLETEAEDIEELFTFYGGDTTPEENFEKTLGKIRKVIKDPVSYNQIQKLLGQKENRIEYLIKLCCLMAEFVQERRTRNEHTLYLLRDCLMFYETHKILDIIDNKETSSDQLLICRKLLSNSRREGGHWYLTQEILYYALEKSSSDFSLFYGEYSRLMNEYAEYNKDFDNLLRKLAEYITQHLEGAIKNNLKVEVVDLGFQGTINILVKYIIDNYCDLQVKLNVDIHLYVLAEWFKSVYRGKYSSETYSLLTHIEVLPRNEYLYTYKEGSFENGKIAVVMGSESDQRAATIDLIILTMTTILGRKLNIF